MTVLKVKTGCTTGGCRLRKAKQVSTDVVALTISQLRAVRGGTKVILMDRGDGRAVPIAKRLSKFGVRRAFVVQGGFRWVQQNDPKPKAKSAAPCLRLLIVMSACCLGSW